MSSGCTALGSVPMLERLYCPAFYYHSHRKLAHVQVRLAWVSAALIVAARSTEFLPVKAAGFIHVLAWGVWLGSNVWTTFIAGITMFKNLPRQTFGKLQV